MSHYRMYITRLNIVKDPGEIVRYELECIPEQYENKQLIDPDFVSFLNRCINTRQGRFLIEVPENEGLPMNFGGPTAEA